MNPHLQEIVVSLAWFVLAWSYLGVTAWIYVWFNADNKKELREKGQLLTFTGLSTSILIGFYLWLIILEKSLENDINKRK